MALAPFNASAAEVDRHQRPQDLPESPGGRQLTRSGGPQRLLKLRGETLRAELDLVLEGPAADVRRADPVTHPVHQLSHAAIVHRDESGEMRDALLPRAV